MTLRRKTVIKTASLALHPSRSLLDRALSVIGTVLDHCGEIAARRGDVAYFGL
jgi:hypothetical protein